MKRKLLVIATILLAAFLRFYDLGKAPLYFDESIHSVFVEAVLHHTYSYNPAYHGPLLFYSLAPIVAALGESEFSLRLLPAFLGVLVVIVVYFFRRYIGEEAALISAFFVAISPVIVNYSRFCRADVYQMLFTALFVYFIFRYLELNKRWNEVKVDRGSLYLLAAFASLSLFACVKETFYPYAVFFLVFFIFDIKRMRITDILLGIALFMFIYCTFYTNFWQNTACITNFHEFPAIKAVEYWLHQHEIARIAGPWYYFLEIILLYDFPAFILAIAGIVYWYKSRNYFVTFLIYWFFVSFLFFSYMQEKVPWLAVHIELPMFILAGYALSKIKTRWKFAVLAVTAVYLLYGCVMVNLVNPVNPAEPAIYMPTQYDVRTIVSGFSKNDTVYVFTTVGEYWPLAWYLKPFRTYYYTGGVDHVDYRKADIIIANMTNSKYIHLNWKRKIMVVRCWSFWTKPDLAKIPQFIIFRKPFADVACMNFTVYYSPNYKK